LTSEEKKLRFGKKPIQIEGEETVLETAELAGAVDWRTKGAVNPVQNQG